MTSTTEPTAVLSIRVSHDLLRTLQGLATRHNRKASQIAAWLLEAGVADYYERRAKGMLPDPPEARSRSPQDPEVRRARASKGGAAGGRGRAAKPSRGRKPASPPTSGGAFIRNTKGQVNDSDYRYLDLVPRRTAANRRRRVDEVAQ